MNENTQPKILSIHENGTKKKRVRRKKSKKNAPAPNFLTIQLPKEEEKQELKVLISLVTKQKQYSVPKHAISVPETINPETLNNLVGEMLKARNFEGAPPKFDFLVGGSMLLSKLHSKLNIGDFINREHVIDVEFVEQLPPPTPQDTLSHDDWVCDIHFLDGFLLTGCCDNSIHIWRPKSISTKRKDVDLSQSTSAHRVKISTAHKAGVNAVTWLPKAVCKFVSASLDQNVLLWQWNESSNKVDCLYRCLGHTSSVLCLATKADGKIFTSASSDGEFRVWSTDGSNIIEDEELPAKKKVKKSGAKKVLSKEAIRDVKGHTQKVTGMVWPTLTSLATCSYDHTVKLWDMERDASLTKCYIAACQVVSIDSSPFDNALLITTLDKEVRLLDPRERNIQLVKKYSHHKRFATRVKWSPIHDKHFVTSGSDNIVKLWDIRSATAPLYEMLSHEDMVLALDFTSNGVVYSGGADCNVKMFST